MNPFAGKSPTERNKIIAALVLGALALGSLFFAFGGFGMFSSGTKITVTASPTPKPSASVPVNPDDLKMPSQSEQDFGYTTTPVVFNGSYSGPDPGRNIFAFYEPPPPCKPGVDCPVPPVKTATPATPSPTPEMYITAVNPQNVYAGVRGFRLEISGERIQSDAKVYFSQSEIPSTFVNEQKIVADVPANFIASEGARQIILQTPDGKKYSNAASLTVQAPPRPTFQYIGMIARKRSNNDTAYFMEQGRQTPLSARLNDVVGGRFRLISISADETVFEDVSLGFKSKLSLFRPAPGTTTAQGPTRPGSPNAETYVPYNPNNFQVPAGQSIPGIPDNIPRYVPPAAANRATDKKDKDDDDDGDGKP